MCRVRQNRFYMCSKCNEGFFDKEGLMLHQSTSQDRCQKNAVSKITTNVQTCQDEIQCHTIIIYHYTIIHQVKIIFLAEWRRHHMRIMSSYLCLTREHVAAPQYNTMCGCHCGKFELTDYCFVSPCIDISNLEQA